MAEASKEAKKRLQQELIRELKALLTEAGLWTRLGLEGRVDAASVLRHTIRLLRQNPAILSPASADPPLDLSTHSNSSSGASEPRPLHAAPTPFFPASPQANGQLNLSISLPEFTVLSSSADASSPLAALGKELENRKALLSELEPKDAMALTAAGLRLAADGSSPVTVYFRLQSLPLKALCSSGAGNQLSLSLSLLLPTAAHSSLSFCTRHGPQARLEQMDEGAVEALGRLPQEILGSSILGLLHKDDAPGIVAIHEEAFAARGHKTKPRPMRFLLPSGSFVLAESEWFVQLNPWTRRVETVVGQHRIVGATLPTIPAQPVTTTHPLQLSFSELCALESQLCAVLSTIVPSRRHRSEAKEDSGQQLSSLRDALEGSPLRQQRKTFFDELIVAAYKESGPPGVPRILIPKESGRCGKSSGEEDANSPPDSHGSGPFSYTYLNTYDKVHRLLQSQPGHSPPHPPPEEPAGQASPPPSSEPLRLTKERLAQHTLHTAREHKETWKRKYSTEASPTNSVPQKARPAMAPAPRAESLSTLRKALEAAPISQALEPGEIPPKQPRLEPASPWNLLKPSPDYYRPNPPPAPGRNVEITTLPLAAPPQGSAALSLQALSQQRQLANEAARSLAMSTASHSAPRTYWPPLPSVPAPPAPQIKAPASTVIQPRPWLPSQPQAPQMHHPMAPTEVHWTQGHMGQQTFLQQTPPPQTTAASAAKEATNALLLLQET